MYSTYNDDDYNNDYHDFNVDDEDDYDDDVVFSTIFSI